MLKHFKQLNKKKQEEELNDFLSMYYYNRKCRRKIDVKK